MSGLAVLVSVMLVSGCASGTAPAADVPASPTVSESATSAGPSSTTGTNTATMTTTPKRCDLAADGAAGVPTARSKPLITIRSFSTWDQVPAPVVVLYTDGTVAVAAKERRAASEMLLPYIGGKFSPCAMDRLELQFESFERSEVGDPLVADAGQALIERLDDTGERTWALHVNGFGTTQYDHNLPIEQQRTRTRVLRWFTALTQVRHGVPLGLDRIAVTGNIGLNSGLGEDLAPVVWPRGAALTENCTILTGAAAQDARSAVKESAVKSGQTSKARRFFTAWFRFPTRKSRLYVMVFPPAVACLPLDLP